MASLTIPEASDTLRNLIGQKEKDLHELNEFRIQALEKAIADRDAEIRECKENLKKLKTDFHYNLKLIEDRDAELERYDSTFASMTDALRERDNEISELRIALDEAEGQIKAEKSKSEQVELFCQDKLTESREKNESLRSIKDEEIRRLRSEMDEMRRDYLRQLQDKDATLEIQRKDMASSFDELSAAQEISSKAREESLVFEIRQREADMSQLRTRLEALDQQREGLERRLEAAQSSAKLLEKRVKELETELHETSRRNVLQVTDHEQQIRALELAKDLQKEECETALAELKETVRALERNLLLQKDEYESLLQRSKQDHELTREGLMAQIQARMDSLVNKLRASEQDMEEFRERVKQTSRELAETKIESQRQVQELQLQLDASIAERQRIDQSAKNSRALYDQELGSFRDKVDILNRTLEERRQDITNFRAELERSNDLVCELRREILQKDVEKDEAIALADKKAQEKSSELVRSLGQQRDRAVAAEADLRRQLMGAKEQDYGTPLDSPIQMPPFPETPQVGDFPAGRWFGAGDGARSRPATAEAHGSRPVTADGHGTRPSTADGGGSTTGSCGCGSE
jgi:chromosome segregation ATPase